MQFSIPEASRITDHWWSRPGWYAGRLTDTFHLIEFADAQSEFTDLVLGLQSALAGLPLLNLVPMQWLHLTVQPIGWADEHSAEVVERVTEVAREAVDDLGPIEVEFGPAIVKGEALVLPARPVGVLDELRLRLRAAVALGTGVSAPVPGEQADGFSPHISIAYANSNADSAPYAAALASVTPNSAPVTLDEVALIRQERVLAPDWLYRWDSLQRISLRGRRHAGGESTAP